MDKIEKIKKLKVYEKPVNHWIGKKYAPYTKRMVDLDEVLKILNENPDLKTSVMKLIWLKLIGK